MTLGEATAATSAHKPISSKKGCPLLGILGVLLGFVIVTGTGRLINVGLADMRRAVHPGLVVIACMENVPTQYSQFVVAPAPTA